MKGFDSAKTRTRGGDRLEELADVFPWPEGDYADVRMVGPIYSYSQIWFTIATEQRPAPVGVRIPKLCLDHNGEEDETVSDVCPFRKSGLGSESKFYVVNVIVRDEQLDEKGRVKTFPAAKVEKERNLDYTAYWAKKGDTRKTPCRLFIIPESQVEKLKALKKLNKVKSSDGVVSYELSDPEHGCDIQVMIDPSKKGVARYNIQKGDRTPITREERKYLIYRPDIMKPLSLDLAKREMKDLIDKIIEDSSKKDGGGKSGSGKIKKGRSKDDDDDDSDIDDEMVDINEDDLDDDEPKSKKKRARDDDDDDDEAPKSKKKRASRDDDDDEDDEDIDLDEDEEDDKPKSKKKRKSDDEDEDDDLDLDEDDEDEPKSKKKRARDDDDDDDDDEAPKSKKRKSRDEDEDEEDDLDLDEDDEEEEKPKRRSQSRGSERRASR